MTAVEYEKRGLNLLASLTGGDIVGHLDKDGKIVRYNKRMHEFASGTIENGIKTYFVVDKKLQSNYYEKQKKGGSKKWRNFMNVQFVEIRH